MTVIPRSGKSRLTVERPFRVKAKRGRIGGGAKADVHVSNHLCVHFRAASGDKRGVLPR